MTTERLRFVSQNFLRDRHTELTEKNREPSATSTRPTVTSGAATALLLRSGHIVTKAADVHLNETLSVQLHDGTITVVSSPLAAADA